MFSSLKYFFHIIFLKVLQKLMLRSGVLARQSSNMHLLKHYAELVDHFGTRETGHKYMVAGLFLIEISTSYEQAAFTQKN